MTDAPRQTRIYVDTNAFIEAFEYGSTVGNLIVRLLLHEPKADRPLFVTSHLTVAELLVKPFEDGRDDLVQLYDNWTLTNPYIEAVPIVRSVLRDSAQIRSRNKALKLADAIHIRTAQGMGCSHFLSNDKRIGDEWGFIAVRLTEAEVGGLLELVAHG